MNLFRLVVVVVVVGLATFGATASGSKQVISRPAPVTTPPGAAEAWVSAIKQGDRREACEMQTVDNVGTLGCAELPSGEHLRCPKGAHVVARKASEVRSLREQIGPVTEETPGRAYVGLLAQKKTSKARGALGLERLGEVWKVTYLRQGPETFAPAGNVYDTETWRKLWYPPTCAR